MEIPPRIATYLFSYISAKERFKTSKSQVSPSSNKKPIEHSNRTKNWNSKIRRELENAVPIKRITIERPAQKIMQESKNHIKKQLSIMKSKGNGR